MTNAISKSLELLDKSRMFEVKNLDGFYSVTFKDDLSEYPLLATYDEERGQGWLYFISGVYNNDSDWVCVKINMLKELMSFCESLSGDAE